MSRHIGFLPLIGIAIAGIGCGTMDERDDPGMQSSQMYAAQAQGTTGADPSGTGGAMSSMQPTQVPPQAAGDQGQQGMQGDQAMQADQAMQGSGTAQADAEFYRTALASGRSEVAISEHVASAASGEVADLARRIASDHTALNRQLQQASGMQQMPEPDAEQERTAQQMQQMTGAQLERAYLDHMAQAHAKSIELYQRTAQGAQDARTRQLAEAALPTLRQHAQAIERLRQQ